MQTGVILAAGKGTRMQSKKPKVLHEILNKSMIEHIISSLKAADVERIIVILGHEAEMVKAQLEHIDGLEFVYQTEQLGTGHAVKQVEPLLNGQEGNTIIVYGDTPLLSSNTIQTVFEQHEQTGAGATVLTGIIEDPTGYGRIVRNSDEKVVAIVEEKDATAEQKLIKEYNSGTYCFKNDRLFERIDQITNDNAQEEYYLTDLVDIINQDGETVEAMVIDDIDEIVGINDRVALGEVTKMFQKKINHKWQVAGVTIISPETTFIGPDVVIGRDTIIHPNVSIYGASTIGEDVIIGMNSQLDNVTIGNGTVIDHSHITDTVIGVNGQIGPYARLRGNCDVGNDTRIGNFVEMKNASFGSNSTAAHLSYLGDAEVGQKVNIGCGSITVNYDGVNKWKTVIEDGAFIGCNVNMLAPVTVGKEAIIAAGTTINRDVPEDALSVARVKQTNKDGYAPIIRERNMNKK